MDLKNTGILFWHKILLLFVIPIIALTLGIMFATWRSLEQVGEEMGRDSRKILSRQTEMFLKKLVREESTILDIQLAQARTAAAYGAIFMSEKMGHHKIEEILTDKFLPALRSRTSHCTTVYVVSLDGILKYWPAMPSEIELPRHFDLTREPYFPKPSDFENRLGEAVWSQVHVNPLSVTFDLAADAVAQIEVSGKLWGYVGVSVSLTRLIAQFNRHQTIQGSYSFLMDTRRQLVGAPPHARVELSSVAAYTLRGIIDLRDTGKPDLNAVLQKMALGESSLSEATINNEIKYFAYYPLENINWRLGLVVPVRMATAASVQLVEVVETGIWRVLTGILYWVCGLLTLVLLSGILLVRQLTAPIREISAATEDFSRGNFGRRADVSGNDEMGDLAVTFNAMADNIQTMINDLSQVNQEIKLRNNELEAEINERIKAEKALQKSEERHRMLIETMNEGFGVLDADERITYINSKMSEMVGYSIEELIGRPITDFVDEINLRRVKEELTKRRKKTHQPYELEWLRKDGRNTPTIVSPRAISDDAGKFAGSFAVITDITMQKQMEHKLAGEKERLATILQEMTRMRLYLKNIVDSMPSVLIGVDPEFRITQWNRKAEKATGISQEEAQGQRLPDVFPRLQTHTEMVRQAIQENLTKKMERVTDPVDGETHYSDITVYPLGSNGVESAVIRVDDVTARVRLEDMMIQSEKMMSVGGLAAGMAHEINNPLGGILQGTQNILRRISPDLPKNEETARKCGTDLDKIRSYLEMRNVFRYLGGIRESGMRAADIVANMLSFSRRSDSLKAPVDLTKLLDKTVAIAKHDYDLKKKYDFRHIEIVRDFPPDLPNVACVPTEIEQVLLNLLRNAAQAMADRKEGGKIRRITLRLRQENDMICMELEDNGPGMDEKNRKRVFDPFFTTKAVGIGTGLGLSVSYFIITNNHKGSMAVESALGKGTTFIIRLPKFEKEEIL